MTLARICSICGGDRQVRDQINRALTGTESMRRIASRFGVGEHAVRRHREKCLTPRLKIAAARSEALSARSILARYADLVRDAEALREVAIDSGDVRTALAGIANEARMLEWLSVRLGLDSLAVAGSEREMEAVGRGLQALVKSHPDAVRELAELVGAQPTPEAQRMALALTTALNRPSAVNGHTAPVIAIAERTAPS